MFKYLLSTLVIIQLLANQGKCSSYNPRILADNADTLNDKIWWRTPVTVDDIKENLHFIPGFAPLTEKTKPFEELYKSVTETITDPRFSPFSNSCKTIYSEGDERTKLAVNMLFENVSKLSLKHIKLLKKLENFRKEEEESSRTNPTPEIDISYFLSADKSKPLVTPDFFTGFKAY